MTVGAPWRVHSLMKDPGTLVMALFCVLAGSCVLGSYFRSLKTGEPIHFGRSQHALRIPVQGRHVVLMMVFCWGVAMGLTGFAFGSAAGQAGIAAAVVAAVILMVMVVVDYARLAKAHPELQPKSEQKQVPGWVLIVILLVAIGVIGYAWHFNQEREVAMEAMVRDFVTATRSGDFARAWKHYAEEVKPRYPLDRFERGAVSSGFTTVEALEEIRFVAPFKGGLGQVAYRGRDEAGATRHYTVVFDRDKSWHSTLVEPRYQVRRFTHDTPRIRKAITRFLDFLRDGQHEKARGMAAIRRKGADGESRMLTGAELRQEAEALGLLKAGSIGWGQPGIEPGSDFTQAIAFRRPDNSVQRVQFTFAINQIYPGAGDGIRIIEMEEWKPGRE